MTKQNPLWHIVRRFKDVLKRDPKDFHINPSSSTILTRQTFYSDNTKPRAALCEN